MSKNSKPFLRSCCHPGLKISLSSCCCCLFFTSFSSSRAFSSPALWFKLVLPAAFFGPLLRLRWILISARFGSTWQGLSCISITSLVSYLSLNRIWVGNLHLCHRDHQSPWLLQISQLDHVMCTPLCQCPDPITLQP